MRSSIGTPWLGTPPAAAAVVGSARDGGAPSCPDPAVVRLRSGIRSATAHGGRQRRGAQIAEDSPKCLAAGAWVHCGGCAGAGDDVAELVAAGYPELGVGPVQVRADRAR